MNNQSKNTFQAFEKAPEYVNDEIMDMTNLQEDAENKSENNVETDKLSGDGHVPENDEKISSDGGEAVGEATKQELSWEEKYSTLNDSHLRLIAEFDNYRKRTVREKADLIKSGGATVLTNLLPVIDDFERAINTLQATDEQSSALNGVKIIYEKFIGYLSQQGVKVIETTGQPFDTDLFEAIATFPVTDESQKGLVVDCVQTGYKLYDKVLRHAKVVVGD